MLFKSLFLGLALFFVTAQADRDWREDQNCGIACNLFLAKVPFSGNTKGKKGLNCTNPLVYDSLFLCAHTRCGDASAQIGLDYLNATCSSKAYLPSYSKILSNFTDAQIAKLPIVTSKALINLTTVKTIVLPADDLWNRAYRSVSYRQFDMGVEYDYSVVCYYFWAIIIAIGMTARLVPQFSSTPQPGDIEQASSRANTGRLASIRRGFRQYISNPALFNGRCASRNYIGTVPSRIQSLTIFAYVAMNIILLAINYKVFADNLYFPGAVSIQTWRWIAERTGVFAITNLPILWLFAQRNNVLLWLTGWDYSTYNTFHRWIARLVAVESVVHGVAYTVRNILNGGAANNAKQWQAMNYKTGAASLILFCLMLPLSSAYIRMRYYEIFLCGHIAFATSALVLLFYHLMKFSGQYNGYIWAVIAIWSLDRLLRIARLAWCNFPSQGSKAVASYDAAADMIRIEVSRKVFGTPSSGSHYFVYLMQGWRFYQSHPFTLADWQEGSGTDGIPFSSTEGSMNGKSGQVAVMSMSLHSSNSGSDVDGSGITTLTFLLKPHKGFTARLRDTIIRKAGPGSTTPVPVSLPLLVEGPYGQQTSLRRFTHVLYIVGGSGITVALADLCAQRVHPTRQRRKLVWASRKRAQVETVLRNEQARVRYDEHDSEANLAIEAYITGVEDEMTEQVPPQEPKPGRVKFTTGRPCICELVDLEVDRSAGGRLAVVVCGPGAMADEARRAVVSVLGRGVEGIEFVDHGFGW